MLPLIDHKKQHNSYRTIPREKKTNYTLANKNEQRRHNFIKLSMDKNCRELFKRQKQDAKHIHE